jgi:hypothetical protein
MPFLRASARDFVAASTAYQLAYDKAEGEGRGVVAHFMAGHLSRNMRQTAEAVRFARVAHELLDNDETAVALGNYLVWTRCYDQGIQLIERAVKSSEGKIRLIAISSLTQAYLRWSDYAIQEDKNPLLQFKRANRGLMIANASIEAGVVDSRLRQAAADCATRSLRALSGCIAASLPVAGVDSWLSELSLIIVRFSGTARWPALRAAVDALAKLKGAPVAAARLKVRAAQLEASLAWSTGPGDVLVGEVAAIQRDYAFIRHPAFPSNLVLPSKRLR